MDQERIIGKKSQSQTNIRGRRTRATRIPTYETPEPFRLCNHVLGIQGKHNISPKLANPTSSCIHPSTHNREKLRKPSTSTFEKHPLYKLWRYSRTPAPVLGGVEVISPTNCIKEIFDVGEHISSIPELQR